MYLHPKQTQTLREASSPTVSVQRTLRLQVYSYIKNLDYLFLCPFSTFTSSNQLGSGSPATATKNIGGGGGAIIRHGGLIESGCFFRLGR